MTNIEKNKYNWNGNPIVFGPSIPTDYDDLTIVDLFCGPGGISEGFEQVGFESVIGVDIHEPSIDTYKHNHDSAYTILGNIKKVNGGLNDDRDILDVIDDEDYGSDTILSNILDRANCSNPTVLAGGVPCQGFSIANKKRSDEDERNYLFEEFIRGVLVSNPEYILIENVSTMTSAKDGEFVDSIETCLEKIGYTVEHKKLSAKEYGVPQKRDRLFFMGALNNDEIIWPDSQSTNFTVGDAIGDLETLSAGESGEMYSKEANNNYQRQMRKDSNSVENHVAPNHQDKTVERIQDTEPGNPMYERFKQRIRLSSKEPSPTIIAGGIRPQFQFGHPSDDRGLTVRERARIQSFPDNYNFKGGMTQGRVQTGMSVPPKLASALAECILEMKS